MLCPIDVFRSVEISEKTRSLEGWQGNYVRELEAFKQTMATIEAERKVGNPVGSLKVTPVWHDLPAILIKGSYIGSVFGHLVCLILCIPQPTLTIILLLLPLLPPPASTVQVLAKQEAEADQRRRDAKAAVKAVTSECAEVEDSCRMAERENQRFKEEVRHGTVMFWGHFPRMSQLHPPHTHRVLYSA